MQKHQIRRIVPRGIRNSACYLTAALMLVFVAPSVAWAQDSPSPSEQFFDDVGNPPVTAERMLDVYEEAAALQCPDGPIEWQHIAAVAMRESTHGRAKTDDGFSQVMPRSSRFEEYDTWPQIVRRESGYIGEYRGLYGVSPQEDVTHSVGPMQFLPRTWEYGWTPGLGTYTVRTPAGISRGHGTDGRFPDPHNMRAAAHAAAAYLCVFAQRTPTGEDPILCAFAGYNGGTRRCDELLRDSSAARSYAYRARDSSEAYIRDANDKNTTTVRAWIVNDAPRLEGPEESWYPGRAGRGYGANNYRFTYAIGGNERYDNVAIWDFAAQHGRYELQTFVPCWDAVASVTYQIVIGSDHHSREVTQASECGAQSWTTLGQYDIGGHSVTVTLADNASRQHINRDGPRSSRIGVDAMRIRCVADCDADRPETPTNLITEILPYGSNKVTLKLDWSRGSQQGDLSYRIAYSLGGKTWRFQSSTSDHQVIARADRRYEVNISSVNSEGESLPLRTRVVTTLNQGPQKHPEPYDKVSSANPRDYPYAGQGCIYSGDPWGMFIGQCTSYVAWRLNDAGVPFHNTQFDNNGAGQLPYTCTGWCGHKWGHAEHWDDAAHAVGIEVNQVPHVGSVAHWNNRLGHVAYVEYVSDDGREIVVSESNNPAGSCDLAVEQRILKGESRWPDSFIHFEKTQ